MDEIRLPQKDQEFLTKVEKINKELSAQVNLVDKEYLNAFDANVQNLFHNIIEEKDSCRLLRIGIIGCVKAGKSSFLNALLFGGKSILPKAATPMTAALTKLSYAEKAGATIHFFKKGDWERIKKIEKQYQERVDQEFERKKTEYNRLYDAMVSSGNYLIPVDPPTQQDAERSAAVTETQRSCHEIVSMIEQNQLSVEQYLDKEETFQADSYEALMNRLGNYVGAKGTLTPLVNYVELRINLPLLQNLEVIDTPGLNDPVVSRSLQTQKYLESCDVILLLSSVGQFLGEQEFSLLSDQLPKKGVNRAYLIGTQLDSGIRQYPKIGKKISFVEAYNGSINTYNKHAEKFFQKLSESASAPLIQSLRHTEPVYVCSLAEGVARKKKKNQPFDAEESCMIEGMRNLFYDFEEQLSDADSYREFSGFAVVRELFDKVRADKKQILDKRAEECISRHANSLLADLEDIQTAVKTTKEALAREDVQSLQKKLQLLDEQLNSIRPEVSGLFRAQAVNFHSHIQTIKLEIGRLSSQYTDLQIDTRKTNESESEDYGFLGLMKRTVRYTVSTKVAKVSDAVENVQNFAVEALALINKNLQKAFDSDTLQTKIKECVIGVFDLSDTNFNNNEILLPLSTSLKSLSVAPISYDFFPQIQQAIYSAFDDTEGVAEGNSIHKLYRVQQEQLSKILTRCVELLDKTDQDVKAQMDRNAGLFVDTIQAKVGGNIEMIRHMLNDREQNLHCCEVLLKQISMYKAILSNFC